jgi:aldehyde dehydrogenase (NAD+)
MDVQKISLTGSIATGRKVQDAATRSNLKRVTLELGGKSPSIIFDDANLEKAIFWSKLGITINAGQVCAASSRLYVQEGIADQVIEILKKEFTAIADALGADPQEKTTTYGPLVDKVQYDQVRSFIEQGKKEATLVAGGDERKGPGHYIGPVIFLNPNDDAKVYKQEIFGPVLCVKTFKTEEEVLRLANNTTYGLAGMCRLHSSNIQLADSIKGQSLRKMSAAL